LASSEGTHSVTCDAANRAPCSPCRNWLSIQERRPWRCVARSRAESLPQLGSLDGGIQLSGKSGIAGSNQSTSRDQSRSVVAFHWDVLARW
jgi:hypothetical protein